MDAEVLGHAHERTLILHLETKEFGHLFNDIKVKLGDEPPCRAVSKLRST